MGELIRKTWKDTVAQYLIDSGKNIVDCVTPLGLCKKALETIEEHNRDRFIQEVLDGLKDVDTTSLDAEKSLKRLYKSSQVISKAMTQDKINRFKNLTINGIINQNSLSDDNYDLFVRLTDTLVDIEYIYLYTLVKFERSKKTALDHTEKKVIDELKEKYGISCSKLDFIRNSLAGYGLVNLGPAIGGQAFKDLAFIAYEYIDFVQGNQQNSNELEK